MKSVYYVSPYTTLGSLLYVDAALTVITIKLTMLASYVSGPITSITYFPAKGITRLS